MKDDIPVPVCVIGEAAGQAVTSLMAAARNIRLISLHWQKAMVQEEFVSQRQRI